MSGKVKSSSSRSNTSIKSTPTLPESPCCSPSLSPSSPSLAVSDNLTLAFAASLAQAAKAKLEDVLVRFTDAVITEFNVDREKILAIWARVAPDCATDLTLAVQKEAKKKESEIKKMAQKETQKTGPHCGYRYGPKANKANQLCQDFCKNPEPAEDGITYCNKHNKQVASKHTCVYVYGEKALKKKGTLCKARVAKDANPFACENELYDGKWLCKRHTEQVNKAIAREANHCTHEYSEKSKTPGALCTSMATANGKCSKHQGGGKKDKAKTAEKDKRKAAKAGGDDTDEDDEKIIPADEQKGSTSSKKKADKKEKKEKKEKSGEKKDKSGDKKEKKDKKDTTEGSKKKKVHVEEKVDAKVNFKLTKGKARPTKFVATTSINDQKQTFTVFVDTDSGLVCINPTDPNSQEFDVDNVRAYGVWANDSQTFGNLTDEAITYADKLNIDLMEEEDDQELDNHDTQVNTQDDGEDTQDEE